MDYNRLFYMNITYKCNNHCVYCISHNTKNQTRYVENPLEIIRNVHSNFKFTTNDLFIVNGGEPTTSFYFSDILNFLLATGINIVVYTNGRKLIDFLSFSNSKKIRWIVPFYGLKEIHDNYTMHTGAFIETFNSLKNISQSNRKRFSIKFLIEDEKQIRDLKTLSEVLKNFKEIHISLVLNHNLEKRFTLGKKLSPFIIDLKRDHIIKLSNLPLCSLDTEISDMLEIKMKKGDFSEQKILLYYFIDERGNVKIREYDRNHNWFEKCKKCPLHPICCDNYKRYRALKLVNNEISLEEE